MEGAGVKGARPRASIATAAQRVSESFQIVFFLLLGVRVLRGLSICGPALRSVQRRSTRDGQLRLHR